MLLRAFVVFSPHSSPLLFICTRPAAVQRHQSPLPCSSQRRKCDKYLAFFLSSSSVFVSEEKTCRQQSVSVFLGRGKMWVRKIDRISSANRRRLGRRLWLVAAIVKKRSHSSCSSATSPAVKAWLVCKRRVKKTTDKEALRIQRLNSQLYERNQSIVQENERLRKQAFLLSEENRLLQQKLQDQLRNPDKVLDS